MAVRLRRRSQPRAVRLVLGLCEAVASLRLAVLLILAAATVLAYATYLESRYGAEAARFGIYGAWWFTGLIILLAVNVLAAALVRLPWKRHQTGFVVVHFGIVVLLAGCLASRYWGIDAQLAVFEGQSSSKALEDTQHLQLVIRAVPDTTADRSSGPRPTPRVDLVNIPLAAGPFNWADYAKLPWFPWHWARRSHGVVYDNDGIRLEVLDYCSDCQEEPIPQITLRVDQKWAVREGSPSADHGLTVRLGAEQLQDAHRSDRRGTIGSRQQLPLGQRIVFWMAKSNAEKDAFRFSQPKGPLGPLGTLVLDVGGTNVDLDVQQLQKQSRVRLGNSGLEAELVRFNPEMLAVELRIHHKTGKPDGLLLFADYPEFNQQAYGSGVYGTYWLDPDKAADHLSPDALARVGQPRLDIILGPNSRLHYRTWISGQVESAGPLPTDGLPLGVFEKSKDPLAVRVEDFIPSEIPSIRVVPLPFDPKKNETLKNREVLLRLSADGTSQTFWLPGVPADPFQEEPGTEEQRTVQGANHRVTVSMPRDEIDLGFRVYLRKFQRSLDPGTSQASHYSSLVDFLAPSAENRGASGRAAPEKTLRANVVITLNAPADFSDPQTGRSYRLFQESFNGPWEPGDEEFDAVVSPSDTRSQLFLSVLTVNYDPGRGLKYAGCLLITIGVGIAFYMKSYFLRRPLRRANLLAVMLALACAHAAQAAENLDWHAWQAMPTFESGRLEPLDTFARATVERVCGTAQPRLGLEGAAPAGQADAPELAKARRLFPDGRPRSFTASELLFSWLAEPDAWQRLPFLTAEHEQLRTELLGLPTIGPDGRHLKYASPWQVEHAPVLARRIEELRRRQTLAENNGERFVLTALDRKVQNLCDAYQVFRLLTFNPTAADAPRAQFEERLASVAHRWSRVASDLHLVDEVRQEKGAGGLVDQANHALAKLIGLRRKGAFTLQAAESSVVSFQEALDALARQFAEYRTRFLEHPPHWDQDQLDRVRARMNVLAVQTTALVRDVGELHRALFDDGYALRLVPALDPAALEQDRDPGDQIQPWLSFQSLLPGSKALLRGYPQRELDDVRNAFHQAAAIYLARTDADRPKQFNTALDRLSTAVRRLGETIEPARRHLPISLRDEAMLKATAYPPVGYTSTELHYNQFDPFLWSWVVSLVAVVCFVLGLWFLRTPMFILGLVVIVGAQGCIIYGFALRSIITGWAPVTNMFETVVFAALSVSVLGVWFTLLPLAWPGLSAAWRMTAIPFTPEAAPRDCPDFRSHHPGAARAPTPSGGRRWSPIVGENGTVPFDAQLHLASRTRWTRVRWILLPLRLLLAAAVFYLLTQVSFAPDQGGTMINLVPKVALGSSMPTFNDMVSWAVGMCLVLGSMWFVPRAVLSILLSVLLVPYSLASLGLAVPLAQVQKRKVLAVVGAVLALLGSLLAYYAPSSVLNRQISPLMPVLRDNFWLSLHVLTVTASYGAGALAWGLSNIAMAYYLFGRYRVPVRPSVASVAEGHVALRSYKAPIKRFPRRPPEACATLGTYAYKAIQVAVLLLAIGTVLGALWADVAWGRFWGWDPKEVWVLVSLLVYLATLHGRYAGWLGNFGLHVGSLLGATAMLMAWYGVNFLLGTGRHTYGEGAGGAREVLLTLAFNWLYVSAAAARYLTQTRIPIEPTTRDEE